MKIAIISFFYTESSICLAKHIARQGVSVDFYSITDIIHDKGFQAGLEYHNAPKLLPGIHELSPDEAPEILYYGAGLPIKWHLLRILSFSKKAYYFNSIIWKIALSKIKKQHYDAIDIIGQHRWVSIIHRALLGENIIHTFHEIGSHQLNISTDNVVDLVISDQSKVIFHSKSTYNRFKLIKDANKSPYRIIPFGKFETSLLYEREVNIEHGLDLSKTTFLFYGYIQPYKGLDVLEQAVKLLHSHHDNFNLIIAGGGNDLSLSYFKSLQNCFVLNRFLSNDEMMKLNRLCDMVVLPYHTASQTGIIPTCFLYGKPVIATAVGAFNESVKDKVNGLLIPPNNPVAFADAMFFCMESPDFIKSLSIGALKYGCGDEFDWNNIAKETMQFMESKY